MSFSVADFFSSMTKVDYIDGSKTLKFTAKMNTSHISDAIKINRNTAGFEAEVKKYVNNNFDVFVNGSPKTLTFTGSQVSGETVWVYFETGGVSDINSLKIKNTILLIEILNHCFCSGFFVTLHIAFLMFQCLL